MGGVEIACIVIAILIVIVTLANVIVALLRKKEHEVVEKVVEVEKIVEVEKVVKVREVEYVDEGGFSAPYNEEEFKKMKNEGSRKKK